ncbi:MAG: N-acetylmuramoyl-L-alanine amidase [Bacillota bacterium]|nr:N-acetylmuramoyl-L-alanine amidase [Bacillota bacterium]
MKKIIYTLLILMIILLIISIYLFRQAMGDSVYLSDKPVNYASEDVGQANGSFASSGKKQRIIVIDAGHGGPDRGASSKSGTLEKDITLAVALKLGPILENDGYKVIYTRTNDVIDWQSEKQDLLRRAGIANDNHADLFVSIHINSTNLKNITGTETYYHEGSSEGQKFARLVQDGILGEVHLKDRGIKTEDYSVLRNVTAPAILTELGYISTPSEEAVLKDPEDQEKFAQGIASGIINYFGD